MSPLVLATLLGGARRVLKRAAAPSVVLLLYDFSDEYTGLLRLAIGKDDCVAIARVFSRLESWRLFVCSSALAIARVTLTAAEPRDMPS